MLNKRFLNSLSIVSASILLSFDFAVASSSDIIIDSAQTNQVLVTAPKTITVTKTGSITTDTDSINGNGVNNVIINNMGEVNTTVNEINSSGNHLNVIIFGQDAEIINEKDAIIKSNISIDNSNYTLFSYSEINGINVDESSSITNEGLIISEITVKVNNERLSIENTSIQSDDDTIINNNGTIKSILTIEDNNSTLLDVENFGIRIKSNSNIINNGNIYTNTNTNNSNYFDEYDHRTVGIHNIIFRKDSVTNIENNGLIDVSSDGGVTYGIYTDSVYNTVIPTVIKQDIINRGSVLVNSKTDILPNSPISTENYAIVKALYFRGYSVNNVINDGLIQATIKDELHSNAYSIYEIWNAPISFENKGTLTGNIYARELDLVNSGIINLPVNMDTNLSTGPIPVRMKRLNQTKDGVLNISVSNGQERLLDGSEVVTDIQYTKIHTTDEIILQNDSTIGVNVKTIADKQEILIGNTLEEVLVSDKGIYSDEALTSAANLDKLNIEDNSELIDFKLKYHQNDTKVIDIDVVKSKTISDSVEETGSNSSVKEVASIFDNEDSNNPEVNQFQSHLNKQETGKQVSNSVETTLPTITSSLATVSTQVTNTMNTIVQNRQSSMRGLNTGDSTFMDKNVWIKGYGAKSKQDDKNGISGFDADTYGVGIGIDGEYSKNKRFGLAFFYTNGNVDTNGVDQNAKLDIYNLVAYGSNPIIDNKSLLYYQIGAGIQKTDSTRDVDGVGTARANYDSKSFFLQVKGTRDYKINNELTLIPGIRGNYKYLDTDSYSENGVGGMGLDVDGFSATSLTFAVELASKYKVNDNLEILGTVAVGHEFHDNSTVSSNFQGIEGSNFSTEGIDNDKTFYEAGLGFSSKLNDDLSLDLNYDFMAQGNDYDSHGLSFKFNYSF